jgi:predicted CoA-binding protein
MINNEKTITMTFTEHEIEMLVEITYLHYRDLKEHLDIATLFTTPEEVKHYVDNIFKLYEKFKKIYDDKVLNTIR